MSNRRPPIIYLAWHAKLWAHTSRRGNLLLATVDGAVVPAYEQHVMAKANSSGSNVLHTGADVSESGGPAPPLLTATPRRFLLSVLWHALGLSRLFADSNTPHSVSGASGLASAEPILNAHNAERNVSRQ